MSKKFKNFISLIILVAMSSLLFAGCGQKASTTSGDAAKKSTLKVALLLSGPINDGGWNTDAYNGLMELKKNGAEIAYTENCKPADIEITIRTYAKNGFNFIIGHGYEYGDALTKVATDYPSIKFLQIGGASKNGKNLASGDFKHGQLSYVAGGIAARTTKTNKIGFVGAQDIPSITNEISCIKARAKEVNPSATVTVAFTGDWTDITKGKEAALAQIANGCDVLIGIGDACDAGAIQACQEKGAKFIGWSGDLNTVAPDIVLTSGVQSVKKIITKVGQEITDGKFDADCIIYGMAEDVQYMGTYSSTIDPKVKELAIQESEDIKSGKIKTSGDN